MLEELRSSSTVSLLVLLRFHLPRFDSVATTQGLPLRMQRSQGGLKAIPRDNQAVSRVVLHKSYPSRPTLSRRGKDA
jgi:hypothetical protein